jgi:proteic killer suppression protein
MIHSFKNKGLKELFEQGKTKKLPQERLKKIKALLAIIHSAHQPEDFNTPGSRLHKLKAPPLAGFYSLDVTGNFRIVFDFRNGNAYDLDYLDTH